MSTFKAVVVDKNGWELEPSLKQVNESELPEGDLTVNVTHTAMNYSDAATAYNIWNSVEKTPHIPGIDFIGTVARSNHEDHKEGDRVLHTSYGVGYDRWGGWAEKAVTNANWVIPIPDTVSSVQAMGLGTVGLTAMLAINAMESNGLSPDKGKVLVTGADGGVGSLTTILLVQLGYEVIACPGKKSSEKLLTSLGASGFVPREALEETVENPMEEEKWAGVMDCIGGNTWTRVLQQLQYEGVLSSVGIVAGADVAFNLNTIIQRGLHISGINSVHTPREKRLSAWKRLFDTIDLEKLDKVIITKPFDEVLELADQKLNGKSLEGRIVLEL